MLHTAPAQPKPQVTNLFWFYGMAVFALQSSLDLATKYYELLYARPSDVLHGIYAHGRTYTEEEYK